MRVFFTAVIVVFCLFCGWLVVDSGLFADAPDSGQGCILLQNTANEQTDAEIGDSPEREPARLSADRRILFEANHAPAETVLLGAPDPNTENPEEGFKFRVELTTLGAAIRSATFSNGEGKGFADRNRENPRPLQVIAPIERPDGTQVLSMANGAFLLLGEQSRLPLDRLHWRSVDKSMDADGSDTAVFEALIRVKGSGEPAVRLTKTYRVRPRTYMVDCDLTVENLTASDKQIRFDMTGPGGLEREGFRTDMRRVVAGFRTKEGKVISVRHDKKALSKADSVEERQLDTEQRVGPEFLWAATVSKYFAGIVVPLAEKGKSYADWMPRRVGRLYDPDGDLNSGDEDVGLYLGTSTTTLAATGDSGSSRTYRMQVYIGPKDKSLFDKNDQYRSLGFSHTIDFLACCCPTAIIQPLAFGILALMKWMYGFIGNYGVVIIILVFFVRLIMHPVTKKSQVSMSRMSELAPRAEEIKKRYANNKAEMNKKLMELYREQGASPVLGFLPMMIQMPIWIALWSAVYASIDLRGAAFLPFWITDLSMPDALWTFPAAIRIPLIGWTIESLNLLPLLMGVAFYLQQKLMPSQASAASNPQVAQQQKMMMIMMPLLFPLMLYKAPSGVNLYIMASTFAGVIEQYVIRKHIREKKEAENKGLVAVTSKTGGKVKKKKPKPFYKI